MRQAYRADTIRNAALPRLPLATRCPGTSSGASWSGWSRRRAGPGGR